MASAFGFSFGWLNKAIGKQAPPLKSKSQEPEKMDVENTFTDGKQALCNKITAQPHKRKAFNVLGNGAINSDASLRGPGEQKKRVLLASKLPVAQKSLLAKPKLNLALLKAPTILPPATVPVPIVSTVPMPATEETIFPPSAMADLDTDYSPEYFQDIFRYMMSTEKMDCYVVRPNFMSHHTSVTTSHRRILMDWLVKVHMKFNLHHETLFIAVDLIDRYLQVRFIHKNRLQLLGVAALLLASKFEEVYHPCISDMAFMTADKYSIKDIRGMEKKIIHELDFQLNKPHPLAFLRCFTKVTRATITEHYLAKYILELSLLSSECSALHPSLKSAAAFQLATQLYNNTSVPRWSDHLVHCSKYTASQLNDTRLLLKEALVFGQQNSRLTSTKNKFRTPRFGNIAKLEVLEDIDSGTKVP